MQYRAAAWAGIATQFAFGFMHLMIFQAFYRSSGTAPPMEWPQLVAYEWLQQAFLALIMLWWQDGDLLSGITDGNAAYELCRPYDLYTFWCMRLAAVRLSSAALKFSPVLIVSLFLPRAYRMTLPPNFAAFGLFLIAMTLSLTLVIALSMLVYILTFVTLSSMGSRLLVGVSADFMMGAIIPIPLMPVWAQRIVYCFPFRYVQDLPFRLYSGHISGADALAQIGVQIAWVAALILFGRWAFGRVMRRVVIQGG
ncbi:MAG: ABC transporter permease [Clostridiales bacterium]|nr:ABC transporter permease [Clostridiales bacterium]